MLLLAPSYYRGGVNLIAGLAEKGAPGSVYRQGIGSYVVGATATFLAAALAAKLSEDEIKERLNPSNPKFLMVPVKVGGTKMEAGFGGIVRSYVRLAGDMAETSIDHPEDWKSLSPDKNPVSKWLRAHAAPVPKAGFDAFTGRDFMGKETDVFSLGKGVLPLGVQQARENEQLKAGARAFDVVASALGMNVWPATLRPLGDVHAAWMKEHPDARVRAAYERQRKSNLISEYRNLETALGAKNEGAARREIEKLAGEGKTRKQIAQRFQPQYSEDAPRDVRNTQRPLFHESKAHEQQFLRTLTPEQLELYRSALRERAGRYVLLRKLLGER